MTRRYLLLSMGLLSLFLSLMATPRSPEQARSVAEQFIKTVQMRSLGSIDRLPTLTLVSAPLRGASVQQVAKSATIGDKFLSGDKAYYVYNIGTHGGYVMVSGDDLLPDIIGYALSGSFLSDDEMPEHIASFLESLRLSLDYYVARQEKAPQLQASNLRPEGVSPLLGTIEWNQGAPWWYQCPMKDGQRCYVGCVATATAQIMRYHEWPNRGEGHYSYREDDGTTHSVNYGGATYNWSMMPKQVSDPNNVSWEERNELSTLCYHVGVACDMQYSPRGSGTYSPNVVRALTENFRYDKNATLLIRDSYQAKEWMEIIAKELNERRPLYYAGASSSGGHAFICDGYDNRGYFHINFGWGGMANSYYLLHLLNPSSLGMGGGTAKDGYNRHQEIIIGIQPDRTGTSERTAQETVICTEITPVVSETTVSIGAASVMLMSSLRYNTHLYMTIRPIDSDQLIYSSPSSSTQMFYHTPIYPDSSFGLSIDLAEHGLPVKDASYVVSIAFDNNGERIPCQSYSAEYDSEVIIHFDSEGLFSIVSETTIPFSIVQVEEISLMEYNESSLRVTFHNSHKKEIFPELACYFEDQLSGEQILLSNIRPLLEGDRDTEVTVSTDLLPLPAGRRGHIIFSGGFKSMPYVETLPETYTVNASETGKPYLEVMWEEAEESLGEPVTIDHNQSITVVLQNSGKSSQPCATYLWAILNADGEVIERSNGPIFYSLAPGASNGSAISISAMDLTPGQVYTLELQAVKLGSDGSSYWIERRDETRKYSFKIGSTQINREARIVISNNASEPFLFDLYQPSSWAVDVSGARLVERVDEEQVRYQVLPNQQFVIFGDDMKAFSAMQEEEDGSKGTDFFITGIDFSRASKELQGVELAFIPLNRRQISNILSTLPDRADQEQGICVLYNDLPRYDMGNRCSKEDVRSALEKNWQICSYDGERLKPYDGEEESNTPRYKVTLQTVGEGTISIQPNHIDLKQVPEGEVLKIKATPNDMHHELVSLTANGIDILASKEITITEDVVIVATFQPKKYQIVFEQPLGANIKVLVEGRAITSGDEIAYGSKGTVSITPKDNWSIRSVRINGADILEPYEFIVSGSSEIVVVMTDHSGIDQIGSTSIQIYPNPMESYLVVEVPADMIGKRARLITLSGELVADILLNASKVHYNVEALATGQYILTLGENSYIVTKE